MKRDYSKLKLAVLTAISFITLFHFNYAIGQLAPNPDFIGGAKSYTYKSEENTSLILKVLFSPLL